MLHLPPPSSLVILWATFISSLAQDHTLFLCVKNLKFCSAPKRLLSKMGSSEEVFMAVTGIIRALLWKDKVSTMESGRSESKRKETALLLSKAQCRASKEFMSVCPQLLWAFVKSDFFKGKCRVLKLLGSLWLKKIVTKNYFPKWFCWGGGNI